MDKYEKKYVELPNKETYAYIEQGSGAETILLIHGNMSSSLYYFDFLDRMKSEKQYRIIALDLRGFGDSSYLSPFSTFDDLADDVILFCQELNITKCLLIGWSAGAAVSYRIIAKKPDLVKKFVSLSGASYRGYPIYKKTNDFKSIVGSIYLSKEEMSRDPVQVLPMLNAIGAKQIAFIDFIFGLTMFNVKKPDKDIRDMLFAENLKQRNLVDVDWSLANFNMSNVSNLYSDGTGDIGLVECPVLLVWGNADLVVTEAMVNETERALKNCTKIIYPNASHALLLDEPERFKQDVLAFFASK